VDDAINVTITMAIVGIVVFGVDLLSPVPFIPRSVPLTATLTALVLAWGLRLVVRRYRERSSRPDNGSAQRVIIYGAGSDGQQLVRSMLSDPTSGYLPVALLDDDPGRQSRRVSGVAVRGTGASIATVASQTGAQLLIIAQRGADGSFVREVARAATDAGLRVKVLPPLIELLRPWVGISDLRDLDITDLLGRRPVDIDVSAIASYLSNRRVLVTGAGGSIGSELCRQISRFGPAELIMLDRDESALHATQLSIYGRALLDSSDVVLCDIRDSAAVTAVFADRRPDVVFHAAALKHLPMLEQYPTEAWKTNVLGTQNVVEAAQQTNVRSFVNISTDKAANPTSVLGRSKRIGEQLVAHAAFDGPGVFLSVRFGNVLGSRGSVLTTFAEQLAHGRPITITHPDVTRFFMTIPEAVQLVIYAAAIGKPGEALVLDMGAPVRIADVARQLMEIAGRSAEIVYTGLRPGEKLHEELFGDGEVDHRPIHPSISHVAVPMLNPMRANDQASALGPAEAMTALAEPGPFRRPARIVPPLDEQTAVMERQPI
jgi:FlaA1/EpsC-like NDP-sugar epimerase